MSRRMWLACGIFGLAVSAGLVAGEARAQAPCPLPDDPAVILDFLWPLVDTNGDGGLSLQEAQAIYPELDAFYFSLVDSDRNGRITKNELLVLLPLLGGDFLALIDTNGDRVITYSEVSDYVTPAQFAQLDTNGDGRIDCRDLEGDAGEGEGGPEGEVGTDPEGEWPNLAEYCQYLPLVVQYFPTLDTNNSGGISRSELMPVILIVPDYDIDAGFALLDLDSNGEITLAEINHVAATVCGGGAEGEGEGGGGLPSDLDEICQYLPLVPALFPSMDLDGSGGISVSELTAALAMFGVTLDAGEITLVYAIADTNNDGEISLAEFDAVAQVACGTGGGGGEGEPEGEGEGGGGLPVDLDEICQYLPLVPVLFPSFDTDGSGGISASELIAALAGLGVSLDPGEIALVYAIADTNNDGEISLAEFDAVAQVACGTGGGGGGEGEAPFPDLAEWCAYLPYLPAAFPIVDTDGSGGISLQELRTALGEFGLVFSEDDVSLAFDIADANGDGELSLQETQAAAQMVCGPGGGALPPIPFDCEELSYTVAIAMIMDLDGSGTVSVAEMRQMLLAYGWQPGEWDGGLLLFAAVADQDGDGELSQAEFQSVYQRYCSRPGEGEPEGEPGGGHELEHLCQYLPLVDIYFDILDADNSGGISLAELMMMPIPMVLPAIDIAAAFAVLDADGDGEVTRAEIAAAAAVICDGEAPEGETEPEGEPGGEGEGEPGGGDILALLCGQLPLIEALFPLADTNGDGRITLSEIHVALSSVGVLVSDVAEIFAALDADNDGGVTLAEIRAAHAAYCGDAAGEAELALALTRSAGLNNRYVAGETLRVTATISGSGAGALSALGLAETLPEGWTLAEVVDAAGAESAPEAGAEGTIEFAWLEIPALPVTVVYDVAVPADASGATVIVGEALYRVGEGGEMTTGSLATLLLSADAMPAPHSADFNGDGRVNLSEVLRVIQLYNLAEFHCDDATEDGYAPGAGPRVCAPHASDYNPQDWKISLSELLRMIQLYNVHGGYYHANPETEDGYAPGLAA